MKKKVLKTESLRFLVTPEVREMLEELTSIHDRSMTGVFETLVKEDHKKRVTDKSKD